MNLYFSHGFCLHNNVVNITYCPAFKPKYVFICVCLKTFTFLEVCSEDQNEGIAMNLNRVTGRLFDIGVRKTENQSGKLG